MKKSYLFLLALIFSPLHLAFSQGNKTKVDFEANQFPPINWTVRYANITPTTGNFMCLSTEKKDGTGNQSFRFSSSDRNQTAPYQQYLISPEMELTKDDTLKFRYLVPSSGSRYFKVGWSTTGNKIEDFTWSSRLEATDESWSGYEYWSTYTKTDLPAGTKFICIQYDPTSASPNTYFYIDNITIPGIKPVNRPQPYNITRDETSGIIGWTEASDATQWEYILAPSIGLDLDLAQVETTTQNSINPTNLIPLTYYSFYVRSVDNEGNRSIWSSVLSFRTDCPEYFNTPWTESFENIAGNGVLPDCQSVENPSLFKTQIEATNYNYFENRKPHTGEKYAYFENSTGSGEVVTNNWFFSPKIKLEQGKTYRISTWYITDQDYGFDTISLGLGDNPEGASMKILKTSTSVSTDYYKEISVEYTPSSEEYIYAGIFYSARHDKFSPYTLAKFLSIDNFSVTEINHISAPSELTITHRDTTKLEISWSENTSLSPNPIITKREISIGLHGTDFQPEDSILNVNPTSNTYLITTNSLGKQLTPNTEYDIYVRVSDANNTSEWNGPLSIKTDQPLLTQLPITEDFSGMEEKNILNGHLYWASHLETRIKQDNYNSTYSKRYGHNDSKYMYWAIPSTSGIKSVEWIILRGFQAQTGVSYDFSAWFLSNGKEGIDSIEFYVGDQPNPENMTQRILQEKDFMDTEYRKLNSSYVHEDEGKVIYFAIRLGGHSIGYSSATLCIDDINLQLTPKCAQPQRLLASNILSGSANLQWEGEASSFQIAWSEGETIYTDNPDGTINTPDNSTSYQLEDLLPQTTYTVAVRSECEDGIFSQWSEPITFTTLCATIESFPIHENFENFGNTCWNIEGFRYGELSPSSEWELIHSDDISGFYDILPLQGNYAMMYKAGFKGSDESSLLYSPQILTEGKDSLGIDFYWWNMEDCDNEDTPPASLYLLMEKDGTISGIDTIQLCGCMKTTDDYRNYRTIIPSGAQKIIFKTTGNSGNSNTIIDSITIDAFNTSELPIVNNLSASVNKNHITLLWDENPEESSVFRALSHYVILRDGIEIARTSRNTYTDSLLSQGEYNYEVAYVTLSGVTTKKATATTEVSIQTYEVEISKTEVPGFIEPKEGIFHYAEGETLKLQAQAIENVSRFLGWEITTGSTKDTITDKVTTLTISTPTQIKAIFEDILYPLFISMEGKGILDPKEGTHLYKGGDSVVLRAEPLNNYWVFKEWIIGKDTFNESEIKVVINDTVRASAIFEQLSYTLTMRVNGEGEISPEEGRHTYLAGDTAHISAIPAEGFRFAKWTISNESVFTEEHSFVVERATTVTAYFEKLEQYFLTISTEGEGEVSPDTGSHKYFEGSVVTLTATATEGWMFQCWVIGSDSIKEAEHSLTIESDISAKAIFRIIPEEETEYPLTVSTEGNGSVNPEEGKHIYTKGESVKFSATPDQGWEFSHWSINDSTIETSDVIWIIEDTTMAKAFFVEKTNIEEFQDMRITIYPNPSKGMIHVQTDGIEIQLVEVYTINGLRIYSESVANKQASLNLEFLGQGTYLLKIYTRKGDIRIKKIILQ